MSALLWTLVVLGIFEVGGAVAYLVVDTWPERTRDSVALTLVFWVIFAAWAGYLLLGK